MDRSRPAVFAQEYHRLPVMPRFPPRSRSSPQFARQMQFGAKLAGTSHPSKPVLLWDSSGFDSVTMEAIPGKGDRKAAMRWYWEAGHFKSVLGDLVLDHIFGRAETNPGFGVLLEPANVEERIAVVRTQESDYRYAHSREVEQLEHMAAEIPGRQQGR